MEEDQQFADVDPFRDMSELQNEGVKTSTYAVGDVQGCLDDLLRLLDLLEFDPEVHRLWLTGDLVNRGPDSVDMLRFVRGLGGAAICVLGNHDLYLLAAAADAFPIRKRDTLTQVLDAPDCEELLFWLRHQPLLHHDPALGYAMVHAGLPPQWDLTQAQARARELETVLQNSGYEEFFEHMYGDKPRRWRDDLAGWERLRFIANCFTQIRWCDRNGRLDLTGAFSTRKGGKRSMPWFRVPGRASKNLRIVFGHWAALVRMGVKTRGVYPLDTGCAERGHFTALRLEDRKVIRCRCRNQRYL